MSFAAMAAWQALALLAGAAGLAAWLFFRKVRPPRVDVPSLLLWRRVFDQSRALTWWERVRRAVSLVATVLIAVFLALAVTRPAPRVAASASGRRLVVLDSSMSMLGRTADGRTRWAHAVALARRLAASAGAEDVSLATTGEGLVEGPTSDTALIESALDRLTPVGGADVPWPRVAGTDDVHFVTDGARARPIDSTVSVHSVFESAPNVAVTAMAVRPPPAAGSGGEAYVEIANYAAASQSVRVTITRGRDAVFDQSVEMAAGEAVRQVVPIAPAGDPQLRAQVRAPLDALAEDDEAVAWIADADPLAVTVVSDQPAPLASLLQRATGLKASFTTPAAYRAGREDVIIFDRWLPAEAPARPALCLAPPSAPWLGTAGAIEKAPRWTNTGAHALVAGVDPLTLDIVRASAYDGAGIETVARSDQGTPLVEVVDRADRRIAIVTFGLADSNLAFAQAFPVLVGNAIDWLARPAGSEPRRPGLAELPASTSGVTAPNGRSVPIVRAAGAAFARLTSGGLYRVDAGGAHQAIAVNVGDPETSNLARTTLARGAAAPPDQTSSGRAWWVDLAAAALALVTIEWWTWQRRITV
ncbi:MAG: hypothetical protein ACHQO8_08845 [Vicinamibacterales bacterium]